MNKELEEKTKGDVLDFKLEYSGSLQEFDGVDYADLRAREEEKKRQEALAFAMSMSGAIGKRERTKKVIYNAEAYFREQDKKNEATMPKPVIIVKERRRKIPKPRTLPRGVVDRWKFYNADRLQEIREMEEKQFNEYFNMATADLPPEDPIKLLSDECQEKDFYLSKEIFEKIIIENNLLNHLNSLLKDLLNEARGKFCTVDNLSAIILVGGGTQIPLIKEWITKKIPKIEIKSPPPIESIALGALAMTPGVKIKDILNKGLSIKLLNKRDQTHSWHPIFFKGQTWPTENPFKLILQASRINQTIFEIIIGETKQEKEYDVIFENGFPKLSEIQSDEEIVKWDKKPLRILQKNFSNVGEDSLVLYFKITKKADLTVKCFDIKNEFLGEYNLGNIY